MLPYVEHFISRYYELDQQYLLRLQALCNYMEEAAGLHADALGVGLGALRDKGLTWVLAKMRLDLRHRPGGGEAIRVETWPVSVERLQFRRDFLVTGEKGETLARAVTVWVVVGLESRRLERIPEDIAALKPEKPKVALEDIDIRIPVPADMPEGPRFPVRLSDIDQNRHVNNNRYVDFLLEAADVLGTPGVLRGLDIIFRAEGLRGDVIASRTKAVEPKPENGGTLLLHSLYRLSDGQELVRARTFWE